MARPRKPAKAISALASFSMPVPKDHESVSFRKIDNGFVVNHHGMKGGKTFEREFYSNKAPKLGVKPKRKSP